MKQPKSILITGASSGIGQGLAEEFAAQNITLALFGRHIERLEKVQKICKEKGAKVYIYALDITDSQEVAKAVLNFHHKSPIDLVVANAGIGTAQSAEKNEGKADFLELIHTNILGIHYTIEPLIPLFKERGFGQIALMSSIASYRGFAKYYVYNGTKAYLRIYGEGLRLDLKRFGIEVSIIVPGFVKTPLTDKNKFKMPLIMDTSRASKIIIKGLKRNKSIIAFPFIYHLLIRLIVSLPISIADKIAEKIL